MILDGTSEIFGQGSGLGIFGAMKLSGRRPSEISHVLDSAVGAPLCRDPIDPNRHIAA
jgi:hypothetical protein